MLKLALVIALAAQISTFAASPLMRTWTASNGTTIRAELTVNQGAMLTLKKESGETISINKNILSKHDLEYFDYAQFFIRDSDSLQLQKNSSPKLMPKFVEWKSKEAIANGQNIFYVIFPTDEHSYEYGLNKFNALTFTQFKESVADLKSSGKSNWFTFRNRWEIEQVKNDFYKANLHDDEGEHLDIGFSKSDFDLVKNIPEDEKNSRMNFVYAYCGEVHILDGLILGTKKEAVKQPNQQENKFKVSGSVFDELKKMNETNWKEIRDKLLKAN